MRGLEKRKGSNNWQGRFRIPKHLWDRRDELVRLGVNGIGKTQEFKESLETPDQRKAEQLYRRKLDEWEAEIKAWEALLRDGPAALSEKQQWALAADHAKAFLAEFDDNPSEAPPSPPIPPPQDINDRTWQAVIDSLSPSERQGLERDLRNYLRAPEATRSRKGFAILQAYPAFAVLIVRDIGRAFETMHGADTDNALDKEHLVVDDVTRRLLNYRMTSMMGATYRGLERRASGDYRPIEELENAPAFVATRPGSQKARTKAAARVTFNAIIDAQAEKRSAGQGAKPMPDTSIRKYRGIAGAFAGFRGSDDASTVTALEVEQWRDAMLAEARITNRTIADRITNIGTVINWGRRQSQHRDALSGVPAISGEVELPTFVEKSADESSYTLAEARTVLLAARQEADPRKRWLPWICLYGGMRISEASQLEKEDFFDVEGLPFVKVTTTNRRTLKTKSSKRRVPIHPTLIKEGFMEWVAGRPSGRLFSSGATSLLCRWVRSPEVGLVREELSPNHGLRHLFIGLCRRHGVSDDEARYMSGHANAEVHRKYGSTEATLPGLAREIEKIESLLD